MKRKIIKIMSNYKLAGLAFFLIIVILSISINYQNKGNALFDNISSKKNVDIGNNLANETISNLFCSLNIDGCDSKNFENCFSRNHPLCNALNEVNPNLCNGYPENKVNCEMGYYMIISQFQQDKSLCEELDLPLRGYCKFLNSWDINDCPEGGVKSCTEFLDIDVNGVLDPTQLNDTLKELWDHKIFGLALKTKDIGLCERLIDVKGIDKMRCKMLLSENVEEAHCLKEISSFCGEYILNKSSNKFSN